MQSHDQIIPGKKQLSRICIIFRGPIYLFCRFHISKQSYTHCASIVVVSMGTRCINLIQEYGYKVHQFKSGVWVQGASIKVGSMGTRCINLSLEYGYEVGVWIFCFRNTPINTLTLKHSPFHKTTVYSVIFFVQLIATSLVSNVACRFGIISALIIHYIQKVQDYQSDYNFQPLSVDIHFYDKG